MPRKPLTWKILRALLLPGILTAGISSSVTTLQSADQVPAAPKFLGANACSSSGCHGGGKENQFLVWSVRDYHSQRPFATLTTARSKQIADALQIKDPTADKRCTACHAPLSEVPEPLRAHGLKASESVSCESCHGPAERWLRSHTRLDYTHADRVAAGMRDLKNLYVRANTCVACHQTVELPLLKAGHPELIFELDGQSVSQPKHWREKTNWHGAQAWLVGQAAALREVSWQLSRSQEQDTRLVARRDALLWLFEKLAQVEKSPVELKRFSESFQNQGEVQSAANLLARRSSEMGWSDETTASILRALASSGPDFRRTDVGQQQQARRAERLVLALDRLLADRPRAAADAPLDELFKLAQSLPDFEPVRFAAALDEFAKRFQP